ncbi:MAG: BlaI/MecI/CopY family transcriptional regulator [Firmicutes bacterium]|nr:BlaI/MecI/CopY family transcriptional regulator [Bacillota bacterium]
MNSKIARLPDSELCIMLIIWEADEPVTSAYILERLKGKKSWGATTVLNFLSRLADRGFLKLEKQGRINHYTPIVCEKDYIDMESKSFLERLHNNSVKSFIASLYDSRGISKEDLKALKKFIKEAE